ncbi:hypothetical protein E4U14_004686 [Claviceps sp. LM454 group G7]|nr:hypothetical protein E4U14_004686 [Claviceps sp. LM454 group G7]
MQFVTKANDKDGNEALFTDRKYGRRDHGRSNYGRQRKSSSKSGKCYVCKKPGCWSTNHSEKDQQKAKDKWWNSKKLKVTPNDNRYSAFLQVYEGWPEESDSEEDDSDGTGPAPQAWIVANIDDSDMEDDKTSTLR